MIEQHVERYDYDKDYVFMIKESMDDHIKRGWFIKCTQDIRNNYLFVVYEREVKEETSKKNID